MIDWSECRYFIFGIPVCNHPKERFIFLDGVKHEWVCRTLILKNKVLQERYTLREVQ